MKNKLLYLLPLLAVFVTGCLKRTSDIPPTPALSGTFTGQFRLLHRSTNKVPFDTTKTNLTITLTSTGNYTVTGDTSVVHAGSNGKYAASAPYINFVDKTYPISGTPTKTHLNGIYQFYYDGSVFQMLAYSLDTLALQYDLKKSQ